MMKREMPSLEEQEAVAWYVLERPLVRPNTSYRKAAFYVSLFLAVNSGITILLYYLLRWLGVSSFLPQVIWAFYTEHHIAFVILLTLLQFLVGGIIVLKPMMIGAIRLYQRYAPESVRRRCLFKPTCSEYAILAIKKYGVIRGGYKASTANTSSGNASNTFIKNFRENYGWKDILSGAGYIGTIYNLISDIKSGKSWRDFAKAGVDTYKFLSGAAKTYNNYKKIGNAVGAKTAMAWWAKSITGLKPLGRASTAKNPFARFANNLTNKTSPFNAQFKNVIDNFKGANGIGKAVSSWGAVAATGVLNWFSNKEEQANSNGTMSDGRVVAETITETVVDTALTYGAGIVVGAAITAVAGSVAVPGVVVVAASGAIIAGVNAGVQALTGKSTTEWISDGILDTGKAIGNKIDSAAKSVAGWFWKSPLRIT